MTDLAKIVDDLSKLTVLEAADLAKMLVHRRARRQGLGEGLMRAAEDAARAAGKTLLVLEAVNG